MKICKYPKKAVTKNKSGGHYKINDPSKAVAKIKTGFVYFLLNFFLNSFYLYLNSRRSSIKKNIAIINKPWNFDNNEGGTNVITNFVVIDGIFFSIEPVSQLKTPRENSSKSAFINRSLI